MYFYSISNVFLMYFLGVCTLSADVWQIGTMQPFSSKERMPLLHFASHLMMIVSIFEIYLMIISILRYIWWLYPFWDSFDDYIYLMMQSIYYWDIFDDDIYLWDIFDYDLDLFDDDIHVWYIFDDDVHLCCQNIQIFVT